MEKLNGIVWSASVPFFCSFSPGSRPQSAAYQVCETHIDTICITGLRGQSLGQKLKVIGENH